jgi:hypothetical protein
MGKENAMSHLPRPRRSGARLAVALVVIGSVVGPIGLVMSTAAAVAAPGDGSTTRTTKGTTGTTTRAKTGKAPSGGTCGGFQPFCEKVTGLKGPGTAIVGALCGIGLLIGAAMLGIGQQSGMRIMALSAAAGAGILIGNGVIDVFT